jgi:hypothetical protein
MSRISAMAVCVLTAVLAVGCGTGDDRDQARAAAQGLYAAFERHDGRAACDRMSPSLRAQLVDDEGGPCAKAVLDLKLSGRTPDSVRVYAGSAVVRLAGGGDTVFLSRTAEGWRVDALGCHPDGPGPYDCEEAA